MGLIDNMRDAIEMNGGRLSESDYLASVLELIEGEGGATTVDSLKSNAFNTKRMDSAGICRVTIGKEKQVWSRVLADGLIDGTLSSLGTAPSTPMDYVRKAEDTITDEGTYYGISRRSPSDFSEMAQNYIIPRGTLRYVESDKNEMRLFSVAFKNGMNVAIDGPKGCGKTMGLKAWASEVGLPVYRVNCSEGFTEESFIGYNTLRNGEMVWVDGLLPLAMRNGGILIFDEFRHARPEIATALNPVGDSGTLMLTDNGNEVVVAHKDFRMAATMNPLEGYSGGQDTNQATLDRFAINMNVDYLPAEAEMRVCMEQSGVANMSLARQFVTLAGDLRRMKKEGSLESDTSTRMLVDMMKASEDFNVTEIVTYCMLGRYQPHEQEEVKTVARARLGDY